MRMGGPALLHLRSLLPFATPAVAVAVAPAFAATTCTAAAITATVAAAITTTSIAACCAFPRATSSAVLSWPVLPGANFSRC